MSLTESNEIDKTQPAGNTVLGARKDEEILMKDKPENPDKPEKTVTVEVDEAPVITPKETTPRAILIAAGKNPAARQLVRVKGKHQEPFPDPGQPIKVHQGEEFITTSTGSTPVS